MKTKLLAVAAALALLFAANSAAQAATYDLPLNGTVYISGTASGIPGLWPVISLDVAAVAPSFDPPCLYGRTCDPNVYLATVAGIDVHSSISQYDQSGNLGSVPR
jgi:hypothetical protein